MTVKKRLLAGAVLGSLALASAHDKIDQGVYFGIHTGTDFLQTRLSGNNDGAGPSGNVADSGDENPNVGLFVGYSSQLLNSLYVAGEVGYTYSNTKVSFNLNNPGRVGHDFSRPGYVNLSALAGYCVSPETVLYLRAGTHYGRFRTATDNAQLFAPPGVVLRGSRNNFTFAWGAGIQTHLVKNTMIRLEWTREYAPTVTGTYPSPLAPAARIRCDQTRVNSVKLGIVYKIPL